MDRRAWTLVAAAVAVACGSDEIASGDQQPTLTPGLSYSAETSEIRFDGGPSMLVTLSISNASLAPITLTYPAGCPVRIRLYRPSDNVRVYDETRVPCGLTTPASITISPQATRSLGSGFRGMTTIVGDSLQFTVYRVMAVPQTEGANIIEVPAGIIVLKQ